MFFAKNVWILFAIFIGLGCSSNTVPIPTPTCDASAAGGLAITNHDIYGAAPYYLGYPPYAVDGCSLLYVGPSSDQNTPGDLRLRNLSSGDETIISAASTAPRRPVLAGDWMAWEAESQGRSVIHVQKIDSQKPIVIDGDFDHATEPRISPSAVVFTAWLGPEATADTDIAIYEFATQSSIWLARGPGQQRFADISETHVAWSDFAEDPDGRFNEDAMDVADIVLFNRESSIAEPRPRLGKQAFPMLGATGKLAFLDWNLVHPEPKLVAYDLRLVDLDAPLSDSVLVESIQTAAPYIRPVARGNLLEWIARTDLINSALWRMPTDASETPKMLLEPDSTQRFAPAASDVTTFIGVQNSDGSVLLQGFAR